MKGYKILIFFLLLILMVGAVSADDTNTTDTKDIYVSDIGDDDLNTGSSASPYASIDKAIAQVNDSDIATIHLSEGDFTYENNSDFDIDLNHRVYGGSLTIIGQGKDKTSIDGQSTFKFARFYSNTNITLKDLTLKNFKGTDGGTIASLGLLKIENCRIEGSYATSSHGGAIYADGDDAVLDVRNSEFVNSSVNGYDSGEFYAQGGGAIFARQVKELYLENNTFENTRLSNANLRGVAILSNSKTYLIGNRFINLTGSNFDASIYLNDPASTSTVINNQFINCSNPSTEYSIACLLSGNYSWSNNTFTNSQNALGNVYLSGTCDDLILEIADEISFNNTSIKTGVKTPASLSDDRGNIVKGHYVNLRFVGQSKTYENTCFIDDGKITLGFVEVPENGLYDVYMGQNKISVISVNLDNVLKEVWVAPNGNDANSGSRSSPYRTIEYAITKSLESTFTVIVHVARGTYSDDGNIGFAFSGMGNVQIIGEEYSKTVIDAQNRDIFMNFQWLNVTVKNITFTNGYVRGGNLLSGVYLDDCIVCNSTAEYLYFGDGSATGAYVLTGVDSNNLIYTNNNGEFHVTSSISNGYFANNSNSNYGFMYIDDGITVENCRFINNTASEGGVFNVRTTFGFTSKNNYFESNRAVKSGVFNLINGNYFFINDVYVGNVAEEFAVTGSSFDNQYVPVLNFNNCTFTANRGIALGIKQGSLIDCKFTNNEDYAITIVPVQITDNNEYDEIAFDNVELNNNGIYLDVDNLYSYRTYKTDLISLTISFNDLNVHTSSDTLIATVTGPCGAEVTGNSLTFMLNGERIGSAPIINGVSSLKHFGFENGTYVLSGTTSSAAQSSSIANGNVVVEIAGSTSCEVWVSADGSDEGTGTYDNPFKTISHAFEVASEDSNSVIIHLGEGTYDSNFILSSKIDLTIIGQSHNTFIDGQNTENTIRITEGTKQITFKDLTIKNINPDNENSGAIYPNSPILIENANVVFDNVRFTQNHGGKAVIENNGNLTVKNSQFIHNGYSSNGIISGGAVSIDNTLISENFGRLRLMSVKNLNISNSEIKDNFILDTGYLFITASESINVANSKIYNTGNSSEDVLGFDGYGNNLLIPIVSLMANDITADGLIMENNVDYTADEAAFIAFGARGGPNQDTAHHSPINVRATNSTFINFQMIWMTNNFENVTRTFDGCVFKNFDAIARSLTEGPSPIYNISNSIFLSDRFVIDQIGFRTYEFPNGLDLNSNWWGGNEKPVIFNVQNDGPHDDKTFSPDTWLILNVEMRNNQPVITFKLTDGVTTSDYDGSALTGLFEINGEDKIISIAGKNYTYTSSENGDVNVDIDEEVLTPIKTPVDITVIAGDISKMYQKDNKFNATFLTKWGNLLVNSDVTFVINGKNYQATTDANGVATISFDLKPGTYQITSINPITYQSVVNTIKILTPITANKNVVMFYTGTNYYSVKILAGNGNPLAGAYVKFTVNKKSYNVKTDAKGIAVFKNKLQPGNYKITASYNGISVANTIKVKPILSAKNIKTKKKKVKFTVKLLDGKGKVAKSKKVVIKVDKKKYKVKTNKKGLAILNLKLKKGTHKVVSSYAGSSIKNTIKIK